MLGSVDGRNPVTLILAVALAAIVGTAFVLFSTDPDFSGSPYRTGATQQSASGQQATTSQSPGNSSLGEEEGSSLTLAELFNRTQQSVVQISSTLNGTSSAPEDDGGGIFPFPEPPPSELIPQEALGSGFVYDKEGHIITNSHVIVPGENQRIDVTFSDGTIYRASVTGIDQYSDLAVLHVEGIPEEKLVPLPLGNSSDLYVGQQIAAIGNPFGLSGSLSQGIISGLDRLIPAGGPPEGGGGDPFSPGGNNTSSSLFSIPNVIQTDAPINPGNSGGPLLDMEGNVVGMNTAIFSNTGTFAGVGFATPANSIAKVVPVLIERSSYEHAWLGITGTDMTPDIAEAIGLDEPRGFLVTDVDGNGPAATAGIRAGNATSEIPGAGGQQVPLGGDVIISIDSTPVRKIDDLLGYLEESTVPGQAVTLTVWRDGQTMEIDVTLAPRPANNQQGP